MDDPVAPPSSPNPIATGLAILAVAVTVVAVLLVYQPLFRAVNCYTRHEGALGLVVAAAVVSMVAILMWMLRPHAGGARARTSASLVALGLLTVLSLIPYVVVGSTGGMEFIEAEREECGRSQVQAWLLAAGMLLPVAGLVAGEIAVRSTRLTVAIPVTLALSVIGWTGIAMLVQSTQ